MNRRKNWLHVLTLILLVIAVAELFRKDFFFTGMFICFAASAALISANVPKYRKRQDSKLSNLAYLALASGVAIYIMGVFIGLQG